MGIITSRWEAGPLEAVLTPSFGDVVDVLVGRGTRWQVEGWASGSPLFTESVRVILIWRKWKLGGGNSNIFGIFIPKIGEDEPILTYIFFRWVETTNQFCYMNYEEHEKTLPVFFSLAVKVAVFCFFSRCLIVSSDCCFVWFCGWDVVSIAAADDFDVWWLWLSWFFQGSGGFLNGKVNHLIFFTCFGCCCRLGGPQVCPAWSLAADLAPGAVRMPHSPAPMKVCGGPGDSLGPFWPKGLLFETKRVIGQNIENCGVSWVLNGIKWY